MKDCVRISKANKMRVFDKTDNQEFDLGTHEFNISAESRDRYLPLVANDHSNIWSGI